MAATLRVLPHFAGLLRLSLLLQPLLHVTERVVPQRINFHRFASARRDHPLFNLRVHPCELVSFRTLPQQSVIGIYTDSEIRAAQVVLDDRLQLRKYLWKKNLVARSRQISGDSMKKPQRCIGRVVQTLVMAFGKHVWDQPTPDVMRECAEDVPGFAGPAGRERKPLQP